MDDKMIAALARKNAAKAAKGNTAPKNFGKKYDVTRPDDPTDKATIEERDRSAKFFKEMRKREF